MFRHILFSTLFVAAQAAALMAADLAIWPNSQLNSPSNVSVSRGVISRGPGLTVVDANNLFAGGEWPVFDPSASDYIEIRLNTTTFYNINLSFLPVREPLIGPSNYTTVISTDGVNFTGLTPLDAVDGLAGVFAPRSINLPPNAFDQPTVYVRIHAWAGLGGAFGITNVQAVGIQRPEAVGDSFDLNEDEPLTIPLSDLLLNDQKNFQDVTVGSVDIQSILRLVDFTQPANGTIVTEFTGLALVFHYTPNPNFNGTDQFTYRIRRDLELRSPGEGGAINLEEITGQEPQDYSSYGTVNLNVLSVFDPPTGIADVFSTPENETLSVAAPGVLANDLAGDSGGELSAFVQDGPLSGSLQLNADGSFSYLPDPLLPGETIRQDIFTYMLSDGTGSYGPTQVTINVGPVKQPPVANDDSYVAQEGTQLQVAAVDGVLTNDTDPDGDTLHAKLITNGQHGQVSLNDDGSFTYTAPENFHGDDKFTYQTLDGFGMSAVAEVTIWVQPVNDAPTAVENGYTGTEDEVLTVAAPGVLSNDADVDGDLLHAVLQISPLHGSLVLNSNGSFQYTPLPNFSGQDSFSYLANDGLADSEPALVTLTIQPRNDGPTATDDQYSAVQGVDLIVPTINGVLANDTDPDTLETLTASVVNQPLNGSVVLNSDGSFTYIANVGFIGTDVFTYRATDLGGLLSNTATVTIEVKHVNTVPTLTGLNLGNILENGTATLSGTVVDPDANDPHTVHVNWGDGSVPSVVNLPAGIAFFTVSKQFLDDNPTATPADTYQVQVTVTDSAMGQANATLPLQVTNIAPVLFNVHTNGPVPVGTPLTLTGGWSDPGTLDSFTVQVNWGDGTPVQSVNYGPGTTAFNAEHVYTTDGSFPIAVTLLDDDGGQAQAQAQAQVNASANLSIVQTATPNPANIGEEVFLDILVTNHGPDVAQNVKVTEVIPANITITESSVVYTEVSNLLEFTLGTLGVGQHSTINLRFRPIQGGSMQLTAIVTSDQVDVQQANNTSAVTLQVGKKDGADLTGSFLRVLGPKYQAAKTGQSGSVRCQFQVSNRGNQDCNASLTEVYLSDDAKLDNGDTLLLTKRLRAIKLLKTKACNLLARLPLNVEGAGKFIIVKLDGSDVVLEANETNNVLVSGPLP